MLTRPGLQENWRRTGDCRCTVTNGAKTTPSEVGVRAERRRARPDAEEESEMGDTQRPRDLLPSDPLLLTPEEAATVLRVGRTTAYALMKAGELPRTNTACSKSPPTQ